MGNLNVVIHNQNTEEESFRMASYLFMASNFQTALEVVNREFHSSDANTDKQENS